jgi:hypothetical protein
MRRGQKVGAILIVGACLDLLFFFYGVARRSYLALALPVTFAMLAMEALIVWVGWTMMTMEEEDDEAAVEPVPPGT